MSDKKVSELQTQTTLKQTDLMYVVDVGSPNRSKNITVAGLFGSIPSPTVVNSTLTVSANTSLNNTTVLNLSASSVTAQSITANTNGLRITNPRTANISNETNIPIGTIFWDENFIYVKVNSNTIKRASLQSF